MLKYPGKGVTLGFFDSDCAIVCNAFVLACLPRCQGLAKCLESGAES